MIKNFLLTLTILLVIDLVWLGLIAKDFYNRELSPFTRTLNLPAAFLSYILIALGIVTFVLPRIEGSSLSPLFRGAFFGLITYGVYDLVNLATLADWSMKITVIDMLWGATVCGLVTLIVSKIL